MTTPDLETILRQVLQDFGCATGTIHGLDVPSGMLQLRAQHGLPAAILPKITTIPVGKGMAGIAALRREPVQVCNLQTDASGVAKPAATDTRMAGSITVPIFAATGEILGTLGIAKPVAHEFDAAETEAVLAAARELAAHL